MTLGMAHEAPSGTTQTVEDDRDVVEIQALGRGYVIAVPDRETDYIQGRLGRERVPYEYEMLADIVERYPHGGLVVDVGANIGNHSMFLASHGFEVLAYEPNVHLAEAVERSARLNGFAEVHVRRCAVGARAGHGAFVELIPGNLGAQQVVPDAVGDLEVVALDDEQVPGRVDVLKIDVEGGERDVLLGAQQLLRRDRPAVYVECQDVRAFLEVDRWMSDEQYVVREMFNATPTMLYLPRETLGAGERHSRSMARLVAAQINDQKRIRELSEKLADVNVRYREVTSQIDGLKAQRESLAMARAAAARGSEAALREAQDLSCRLEEAVRQHGAAEEDLRRRLNDAVQHRDAARAARDGAYAETERLSRTLEEVRSSVTMRVGQAIRSAASSPRASLRLPVTLWRLGRSRENERTERPMDEVEAGDRSSGTTSEELADRAVKSVRIRPRQAGEKLRVAAILDDFSRLAFGPEWDVTDLSPTGWFDQLEASGPDLLFVESAWRGKDDWWHNTVPKTTVELQEIVRWCDEHGVPTAFWNKEDPVHWSTFLNTARMFDHVFTTDLDRIADYKSSLGHDRVWLLPFGVQPRHYNPLGAGARKEAFVFAGAYYRRYPDRARDLESMIEHLSRMHPVEIFDRNLGSDDPDYSFPAALQSYVRGTLSPQDVGRAYKEYRYAVSLNSVKQSPTMMARRIFEVLASNTGVVSNFSKAVSTLLGDVVVCTDSGAEAARRVEAIEARGEGELRRLVGLRTVMRQHTYADRAAQVWARVTDSPVPSSLPSVAVMAAVATEDELQRVVRSLARQQYVAWTATIVVPEALQQPGLDPRVSLVTRDEAAVPVAQLPGDLVALMVVEDHYGEYYLADLVLGTRYSDAAVLGKVAYRRWTGERVAVENEGQAYQAAHDLARRRSVVRCCVLGDITVEDVVRDLTAVWAVEPQVSLDALSYCEDAPHDFDGTEHGVDAARRWGGVDMERLYEQAAHIAPRAVPGADAAVPQETLAALFDGASREKVTVSARDGGLEVVSDLPYDTHDYVWGRRPIAVEGWAERGEVRLTVAPGLDVQLGLAFLGPQGEKLRSTVVAANCNARTAVPADAVSVQIGLRVRGSGRAVVSSVEWQHSAHVPEPVSEDVEVLVVTNVYPDYDNLYRNGFVHSRVRSYQQVGMRGEVVCVQPQTTSLYREFEGIGVTETGTAGAAQIVAASSSSVLLVHFLDRAVWEALSSRPERSRVLVWVHGSEVQPWWRRAYNYLSGDDLERAKELSWERLKFWRGVFSESTDDVHFVFVSRHFAEEVFEDVGVTLAPDRYSIIHNPIDTSIFAYSQKSEVDRLSVLSVRPYASRKYANDLAVKAVLGLVREPEFAQMAFTFVGDGPLFDETLEPLIGFGNVTVRRGFLPQREVAELHRKHGIFLVPTRMDAQGVSRDEAMASGLVPVTNAVAAVPEFVDESCAELAGPEDVDSLREGILALVRDPARYLRKSAAAAGRVRRQSAADIVIGQEIGLIRGSNVK